MKRIKPVLIIFLSAIIVTALLLFAKKADFKPLSGIASPVSSFAGYIFSSLANTVKSIFFSGKELLSLGKNAEQLKLENERLKSELEELKIYRHENIELRELLEFKQKYLPESIAAEVIGRDSSNWFYRFEIDKGKKQGIEKNMIVTSPSGVVGQVTAVFENTSLVRTIINRKSLIPVYVVESGAFAMLYGEKDNKTSLRYIYNSSLLSEGQLVVTSGIGDIFPGGLLVGKTAKGKNSDFEVIPFANISGIKQVLVFGKQNEKQK